MKKKIHILGFEVEIIDFGYATYMYPSFNGNAEFPVSSKGFRRLSSYLRTINWMKRQMQFSTSL